MNWLSSLIAKSIPWIIPGIFVLCLIYTHKPTKSSPSTHAQKKEELKKEEPLNDPDVTK